MMASNVVRLFADPPQKEASEKWAGITTTPHFEEAWSAYPDSGRKRSSRKLAFAEWKKIAPEVGKDNLVYAVKKYAREDKDARGTCGAPGFDRWLKWGRWEHWLPTETQAAPDARRFPDADIRAKLVEHMGEPWVISWIDPCDYVAGMIITKSPTGYARIKDEDVLKRLGLSARLDV